MRILRILPILGVLAILAPLTTPAAGEVVRIESVELLDPQPHKADDAVIWYDPMDEQSTQNQYFEKGGDLVDRERLGGRGRNAKDDRPGQTGLGQRVRGAPRSP